MFGFFTTHRKYLLNHAMMQTPTVSHHHLSELASLIRHLFTLAISPRSLPPETARSEQKKPISQRQRVELDVEARDGCGWCGGGG